MTLTTEQKNDLRKKIVARATTLKNIAKIYATRMRDIVQRYNERVSTAIKEQTDQKISGLRSALQKTKKVS